MKYVFSFILLLLLVASCTTSPPRQYQCSCNVTEPTCSEGEMRIIILERGEICTNACEVPKCVKDVAYERERLAAEEIARKCAHAAEQPVNCINITPGQSWSCQSDKIISECNATIANALQEKLLQYRSVCLAQKGSFGCPGSCVGTFYCDMPYADGGKICTDPGQCEGTCDTTYENRNCKKCTGRCSTYPSRLHPSPYKIVNGSYVEEVVVNFVKVPGNVFVPLPPLLQVYGWQMRLIGCGECSKTEAKLFADKIMHFFPVDTRAFVGYAVLEIETPLQYEEITRNHKIEGIYLNLTYEGFKLLIEMNLTDFGIETLYGERIFDERDQLEPIDETELRSCGEDRDCIPVGLNCCASANCDYTAINVRFHDHWQSQLDCYMTACGAVTCQTYSPFARCENNQCVWP